MGKRERLAHSLIQQFCVFKLKSPTQTQKLSTYLGPWFIGGLGNVRFMVGLNDHEGVFHLSDSMVVRVGPTTGFGSVLLGPSALSREWTGT